MRLTSLATATVLLALLAVPTPAEDKPPAPKDDTPTKVNKDWGYSFTFKGLTDEHPGCYEVLLFRINARPIKEMNADQLMIYKKRSDKTSEQLLDHEVGGGQVRKMDIGKIEKCTIAGQPAHKVKFTKKGATEHDGLIDFYCCTDSKANEPCWWFEYMCGSKKCDEDAKLFDAAIDSFKVLGKGEKPRPGPDDLVSEKFGCQVSTVGITGPRVVVGWATLDSRVLCGKDNKSAGHITVSVIAGSNGSAKVMTKEQLENLKKQHEKYGHKVVEAKQTEICGRMATRFSYEDSDWITTVTDTLEIADGEMKWSIESVFFPENTDKGADAVLRRALESFALLNDPPKADLPKDEPGKDGKPK